jgi:LAGLIDADG DNA endonuclease family
MEKNNVNHESLNKILLISTGKVHPNSKLLKEYKSTLKYLSKIQLETAIGLILGDVSLQSQNKGKTFRMKFEWGDKNKKYAEHIYNVFNEWILSPPKKKERINEKGNAVVTWSFQTISHEAFNQLGDLFLTKNYKSVVNNLITDYLSERGLAYWFMDEGGKLDYNKNSKNRGLVLNTQSFSEKEVNMMSKELKIKFNLDTNLRLNKNKYIIVINSTSFRKFLDLTYKYIIPSMRYKLPKY